MQRARCVGWVAFDLRRESDPRTWVLFVVPLPQKIMTLWGVEPTRGWSPRIARASGPLSFPLCHRMRSPASSWIEDQVAHGTPLQHVIPAGHTSKRGWMAEFALGTRAQGCQWMGTLTQEFRYAATKVHGIL